MKKLKILFASFLVTLSFNPLLADDPGELSDFTQIFTIRSLETGISLSPFRETSQRLIDQNWKLREIEPNDTIKDRDRRLAKRVPFGYVQFVNPSNDDICLAILDNGFFGGKSCSLDLQDGTLETIFSIMPTNTAAIQIRSLVLDANECIVTFYNPNVPIENRFGIRTCTIDETLPADLNELMFFAPPLIEASVLE
ncbi:MULTISPECIES: cytolethal distending toxin subunit A [Helicobacter]|uniref:Cytolethal distending toxin subunit A n=1 Tax=Helicobacter ibis TaxID=2962633 RepID=A0ABT4VG36_9HELI|nr:MULTISPECIES: cytolethal distending toxin subunit A [Helicobacter]MDA3968015.1 cytolethal distending toxin subunit A [Helicobacter sp. WB40]MDA3969674.1 cytolethal distending toxin subunit A [Helicobacter ibis]